MEQQTQTFNPAKDIKGWGVDADPKNRPAYPKKKHPEGGTGAHYDKPDPQSSEVEILRSIEHNGITSVYGTTVPPRGLSGVIRRFAFRYTENQYMHWLPLLMADRVDMVEGIFDDLLHGHIPNPFKEMGLKSELKYNKRKFLTKIFIGGALASSAYFLLRSKEEPSKVR